MPAGAQARCYRASGSAVRAPSTTVVFRCFIIALVDSGVVGRGVGGGGASGRQLMHG